MFGYVTASLEELTAAQKKRYNEVYCGICRCLRVRFGGAARMGLSYDMTFLALLLMSLYEPEETRGNRACGIHPLRPRPWADNPYIRYAADMNAALAYFQARDDWEDDRSLKGKAAERIFGRPFAQVRERWPRQCTAAERCIAELAELEREACGNPDLPANCFGELMGELLVWQEDLWAPCLRRMGHALGRYIYLADAAVDYRRDRKKGSYNPFLAMGMEQEDWGAWDTVLVLAMADCCREFEKLPLVQDKAILDNILYSGVWCSVKKGKRQEDGT